MLQTLLLASALGGAARADDAVTVGAYAPYAVQPGVRVGWERPLGDSGWSLIPAAAVFARPRVNQDVLLEVGVGRGGDQSDKTVRPQWSVGLGYLGQRKAETTGVNLGSGAIDNTYVLRHAVVPTVSGGFVFGRNPNAQGYVRSALGYRIGAGHPDSLFLSLEAGVRFGGAR